MIAQEKHYLDKIAKVIYHLNSIEKKCMQQKSEVLNKKQEGIHLHEFEIEPKRFLSFQLHRNPN